MATTDGRGVLRLGTRGSRLALAQSGQVARKLEEHGQRVELVVIRTSGDKLTDVSLAKVGGKGLFLKEIEEALAAGDVDFAVHSMKDVPADLPAGFAIAAVPPRADVRDVLIVREAAAEPPDEPVERDAPAPAQSSERGVAADEAALRALPPGARVGTGSLRRRAQLRALRPDLDVSPMRGNVDTRLAKLASGVADALVLAAAGLIRLEIAIPATPLEPLRFLPAPGQGALALEIRSGDDRLAERLAPLHDRATAIACAAERAFLRGLGASCQVPVAAHARPAASGGGADEIEIDGLVASLDGRTILRETLIGAADSAEDLGRELADRLLARGAGKLLELAEREAGTL